MTIFSCKIKIGYIFAASKMTTKGHFDFKTENDDEQEFEQR